MKLENWNFVVATLIFMMMLPLAVNATPLTLEAPAAVLLQQTQNSPCVIGNASCNNPAGFGYTLISAGGGVTSYMRESPVYTVNQIFSTLGSRNYWVGIDLNQAGQTNHQILEYFHTHINGSYLAGLSYDGPGTMILGANGNGYSDNLLKSLDFSGLQGTDTVQFKVLVTNQTDGDEQFFLIARGGDGGEVPEPSTTALLGLGLVGLALIKRKRHSAAAE